MTLAYGTPPMPDVVNGMYSHYKASGWTYAFVSFKQQLRKFFRQSECQADSSVFETRHNGRVS